MSLDLLDVQSLPDPNLQPPTIAQAGDPFAALRIAHLWRAYRGACPSIA